MFLDLNRIAPSHFRGRTFDVCVCGGGVAGITLALRLAQRCSVALLEGGGREYSYQSQSLYKGRNAGLEYFDLAGTRLRFFGGSSNHWEGWLVPLDSHDFEAHAAGRHPGWPISQADLAPYFEPAKTMLEIADDRTMGNHPVRNPLPHPLNGFREVLIWASPVRFGLRYGPDVEASSRIACYLNANVTDIRLAGDRVAQVTAADYAGRRFEVRAGSYVLAMGGIENPRILLNCNRQRPEGLGNQYDLVGRYFAEHPHVLVGGFLLEDGVPLSRMRIFSPTGDWLRRHGTLNFTLRCFPREPQAAAGFKDKLRRAVCSTDWLKGTAQRLRGTRIACEDGGIKIIAEQAANPDSRVTLGDDVDPFGLRQPVLNWQLGAFDKRTMREALLRFGESFADADYGRVRVARWLLDEDARFPGLADGELAGHHHMCTTRMASSPRQGVVDEHQKVHGVNNLYVAGCSAFASGGHANPTFTIVQMSLRLAEHLKRMSAAPSILGTTAEAPGSAGNTAGRWPSPTRAGE